MTHNPKTYSEGGKYYAVIYIHPNGPNYYSGPFNSRSAAYRYSVRENNRHRQAARAGMIYNTRGM